jgi:predicted HD phosphohydrolase
MSDGEAVDIWTHQVQTADALRQEGADDEMVVAGLLHDIGDGRVSPAAHGPWGGALVRDLLGERVAWLIATHTEAKRYACTTDPAYWDGLSPVSRRTLEAQGGRMSAAEAERFRSHRWFPDAMRMRRCDDAGKDPDAPPADTAPLRQALRRVAGAELQRRRSAGASAPADRPAFSDRRR